MATMQTSQQYFSVRINDISPGYACLVNVLTRLNIVIADPAMLNSYTDDECMRFGRVCENCLAKINQRHVSQEDRTNLISNLTVRVQAFLLVCFPNSN